jgi:hypothetical protein
MKIFFIVAAILLSFTIGFAQQPTTRPPLGKDQKENERFEAFKHKILGNLDARMSLLQQEKSCVSAAQNHQDLRKCHEQSERTHKELREQREELTKKGKQ